MNHVSRKKKPVIVGKEINPFQSDFTEEQIEILTTCINEIQLFTTNISSNILKDFFACKLKGVLKSNNNRQLAYLMQSLNLKDSLQMNGNLRLLVMNLY